MRFVLVGDGFPAVETLKLLEEWSSAQVLAVFSSVSVRRPDESPPASDRLERSRYPSHILREPEGLACLSASPFDWLINVNSTVILPADILRRPRCGALNMHPGPLPAYAGLHVHQWALRNGERDFGATIHFIEPGVDTGDIVVERRFPILPEHTGLTLFLECVRQGTEAMRDVLRMIMEGVPLPRAVQDASKRRLYRHRDALDGRVDWRWSADVVERFVRAGNYVPLASPTYTAYIEAPNGTAEARAIELLRVTAGSWPEASAPGEVLRQDSRSATFVACGDGRAVELVETRLQEASERLAPAALCALLPRGVILRGRTDP